jgi:ubiquinol-cytochrome c reductase cytochrome c subunit
MKKNCWTYRVIQLLLIFYLFHPGEAKSNSKIIETNQDSTMQAISDGASLFDGSTKLTNGGSSCITCHNIASDVVISGGLLAKDLTDVYARMGDAGVGAILGSPPFPAMASAFKNKDITPEEIAKLKAFLQYVDLESSTQTGDSMDAVFLMYSPVGLVVWLVFIYFFWSNRKKESVKKEIFDRQIKSIN